MSLRQRFAISFEHSVKEAFSYEMSAWRDGNVLLLDLLVLFSKELCIGGNRSLRDGLLVGRDSGLIRIVHCQRESELFIFFCQLFVLQFTYPIYGHLIE